MKFFRSSSSNSSGENLGTGLGWFKEVIAGILKFRSITATSNKITLADNADDIGIDVNESNLDITTKDHVKTITFLDSPYSVASDDVLIGVDTTGGNIIINLPTGAGTEGRRLYIKKLSSDINFVTINRSGGDTIEGATSHTYIEQYNECILRKINATTWVDESSVIEKRISNILGTGLLTGGRLTVNGGDAAKFDISAGVGFVVDNHTDASNPNKTRVAWTAKIALPTTFLATKTASYVAIDINGNVIQQTTAFTPEQTRDLILLGKLIHPNFVAITSTNPVVQTSFDSLLQLLDFCRTVGPINISGNEFSANGANLNLNKSTGTVFRIGSNYDVSAKNPSIFTSAPMTAGSWTYYYRSAIAGEWTPIPISSAIDPNYWDDGTGTLNDVTAGCWTIQTIYQYAGTNRTVIQYGQAEYSTLAAALSERTTAFVVNPVLGEACFRCWLFVQQGTTVLNDLAKAKFIAAGKFGMVDIVSSSIGGEINTASNQGDAGYGPFYTKLGVDLQFKNIAANSNKIAITDDTVGHNVKIDVTEANVVHQSLSGAGTNAHSAIDSHIGSSSNPHSVTKAQVNLANVTDDAQLKRAAGDINIFADKSTPAPNDVFLIEDSAAAYTKKRALLSSIMSSTQSFTQGLVVSPNVAAPLSKVDISYGGCRSDDDTINMAISTALTGINITASGANGLDAGVEEASQWYAVWLIYNPTTSTYAGLFSLVARRVASNNPAAGSDVVINIANTKGYYVGQKIIVGVSTGLLTYEICTVTVVTTNVSITVATLANSYTTPFIRATDKFGETVVLPSGYTKKRRVGFVRNDSSSNFVPFVYQGQSNHRRYIYQIDWYTYRQVVSGGTGATWTGVHCADYVPSNASVIGLVAKGSSGASAHSLRPYTFTVETQRSWGDGTQHFEMECRYAIVEFQRNNATTLNLFVEYFEEDL